MKSFRTSLPLLLLAISGAMAIENQALRPDALGVNARLGDQGYGYEYEMNKNPVFSDPNGTAMVVNEIGVKVEEPIKFLRNTKEGHKETHVPEALKPMNIGENIPFDKDLEAKAVHIAQQAQPTIQEPYIPDDKLPQVKAPENPDDMPDLVQPYVPEPATPVHKIWESSPVMPDHNMIITPPLSAEAMFAGWNGSYDLVATHDYSKFQNLYDLFAEGDSRVPSHFPGFPLDTAVDASRLPVQNNNAINNLDGLWFGGEEAVQQKAMDIPENAIFVPLTAEDLAKYPELNALIAQPQEVQSNPGKFVRIIPYNGDYNKSANVKLSDIIDLGDVSNSAEGLPEYVQIVDGPFNADAKDPGVRFVKPSVHQKNSLLSKSMKRSLPDASLAVGSGN